jgi:hypothetical protein
MIDILYKYRDQYGFSCDNLTYNELNGFSYWTRIIGVIHCTLETTEHRYVTYLIIKSIKHRVIAADSGEVSISWNDNYCVQSPRCSFCQLTDQLKFTLRKIDTHLAGFPRGFFVSKLCFRIRFMDSKFLSNPSSNTKVILKMRFRKKEKNL